MAVKNHFDSCSWNLWDEGIRLRKPEALESYRAMLTDEIGFYEFQQIKFEEQWDALKRYAHEQGIRIIGDIPIYVDVYKRQQQLLQHQPRQHQQQLLLLQQLRQAQQALSAYPHLCLAR